MVPRFAYSFPAQRDNGCELLCPKSIVSNEAFMRVSGFGLQVNHVLCMLDDAERIFADINNVRYNARKLKERYGIRMLSIEQPTN